MTHREYFNSIAARWDNIAKPNSQLVHYMNEFGVKDGDYVLDIGAGTGRLTQHLYPLVGKKGRVVAEDISDNMLKIARQHIHSNNCDYTCSDVMALPFQPESADKIVCFSVFPHIPTPVKAIHELYRVLKKGGKMLVLHTSCSRKLNKMHASLEGVVSHDILPHSKRLKDMLTLGGFECTGIDENPELYWVEVIKH